MERHFKTQLDGSLFSSFEESLLEIDEEEDTSDFCEPFLVGGNLPSCLNPNAPFTATTTTTRVANPQACQHLSTYLSGRFAKHNKDVHIICSDGGCQIDPEILALFCKRTSFMRQLLMDRHDETPQTVILPGMVHLHDLHQTMTLLHEGKVHVRSERQKRALTELISLLGLSLDGLIVESVPKLVRPSLKEDHQLILSIKTPIAKEDLKKPVILQPQPQQKMTLFLLPTSSQEIRWNGQLLQNASNLTKKEGQLLLNSTNLMRNTKTNTGSFYATAAVLDPTTLSTKPHLEINEAREELKEDSDKTVYSCDLCGLKLGLVAFLKHQKSHINDFPYLCSLPGCSKKFKTLSEYKSHKRVAHKNRVRNGGDGGEKMGPSSFFKPISHDSKCSHCGKSFKSVGSLKTHMISHMNLPALPCSKKESKEKVPESIAKGVFTCKICSTSHVTWPEFSRHFQLSHGVEPKILLQYKCVPCDLLFQTKEVYLEHNKKCSNKVNQMLPKTPSIYAVESSCPTMKPLVPTSLAQNYSIVTKPVYSVKSESPNLDSTKIILGKRTNGKLVEKKHICAICSRGFKRSDNLKAHARTVHYGLKANNCSSCGKGYRTKNELLRHLSKSCPYREIREVNDLDLTNVEEFKFEFDSLLF